MARFDSALLGHMFSGVVMSHAGFSFDDPRLIASAPRDVTASMTRTFDAWKISQVAFKSTRNFYNTGVVDPQELKYEDGYLHEVFSAVTKVATSIGESHTIAVVMSPYSRLVPRFVERVMQGSADRDLTYYRLDMGRAFRFFATKNVRNMTPIRISFSDKREPGLDLVSLSGRNPVRSNLFKELEEIGPPYGIKMACEFMPNESTNLHADKHGNYWWYQNSGDGPFANVLGAISSLLEVGLLAKTKDQPTLLRMKK